jgi:hypothetical protein
MSVAVPIEAPPDLKVTVPVASDEETVAVNVTDCPKMTVEEDEVRTVVVVILPIV